MVVGLCSNRDGHLPEGYGGLMITLIPSFFSFFFLLSFHPCFLPFTLPSILSLSFSLCITYFSSFIRFFILSLLPPSIPSLSFFLLPFNILSFLASFPPVFPICPDSVPTIDPAYFFSFLSCILPPFHPSIHSSIYTICFPFFSLITNIHWVLTVCQMTCQILGILK